MPEGAAAVTPEATTPQAAPPPPPPSGAADGAPPPAANGDGSASVAGDKEGATPAAPPAETPEQRQKRVEAAGKRARREAARNRELQAQIARQNAELQRAQSAQRELDRIESLKKDKWAAAREFGIDPREMAQEALNQDTPEWQQKQAIEEAKREAREAKEALAQFLRQQQEQQQATQQQNLQRGFIEASKAYPDVAKLPEDVRLSWAHRIVQVERQKCQQLGVDWSRYRDTLTDAVILGHMQKSLSGVPASPAKAPETDSTPDAKGNGSASPQTVTSKVASQKFAPPANWDELSDEQQKRIIAQQLEQGATRKK